MDTLGQQIARILEMIKFSHTLFAMPMALAGMLVAARGLPDAPTLFWILMAMVGARSAGMTFNRLFDADIDASNPRTASRHIPAGTVSRLQAIGFALASVALFEFAAWQLNELAFQLSFVALAFLVIYPLMKRLSALAHVVLGLTLAMAPVGAAIAVTGAPTWHSWALAAFVTTWVAGFDIIYALQDEEFDRQTGLHSIPARLGADRARQIAARLHGTAFLALLLSWYIVPFLHWVSLLGILIAGIMLVYEHHLVQQAGDDAMQIDKAFFQVNSYVSIVVLLFLIPDWLLYW